MGRSVGVFYSDDFTEKPLKDLKGISLVYHVYHERKVCVMNKEILIKTLIDFVNNAFHGKVDEQAISWQILNYHKEFVEGMTEDEAFDFCYDIASEVEERLSEALT